MKLTLNDAQIRLNIIGLIPMSAISQTVRIKLIRAQVELEKVARKVQEDVTEGLKKIKPEGFDERYAKYADAIEGKDTDAAKEQAQTEGYTEFAAEYDKVNSEYQELYQNTVKDTKVDVQLPIFSDADLENVAQALPADGTSTIKQGDNDRQIPNNAIIRSFVEVFG
jgi:hypothetical protein